MNTIQAAEFTGIPEFLLVRMRARETTSIKSGPPFCKKMGRNGEPLYTYSIRDLRRWMKIRKCLITAGDAAEILGISREDLINMHGLQGVDINKKTHKGRLVIDNGHAIYVWVPKLS